MDDFSRNKSLRFSCFSYYGRIRLQPAGPSADVFPVFIHFIEDFTAVCRDEYQIDRESGMYLPEEDFFGKGELAAQLFAERKIDATAVVAFNDEFALGMCKRFHALGIQVPRDISLIGIDGSSARKYRDPCLTSVGLFPEKQGARCVDTLLDMLEGKKVKYVSGSPIKLIKGDSVRKLE